ncbi:hypothetical protein [Rhizobium sp. JAB6]|nr:hypothetical protein [Rhizobium sp. JAB6]
MDAGRYASMSEVLRAAVRVWLREKRNISSGLPQSDRR